MDPLDRLMDATSRSASSTADPRARGAFALRVVMGGRWSIDVRDRAALSVLVMLSGHAVLSRSGRSIDLEPGDLVLLPLGERYVVADAPDSPPLVRILPDQVCESPDGTDLALDFRRGVRTWGNAGGGETTMLLGAYEHAGAVGSLTLASLPPVAHLPAGGREVPVVDLLVQEMEREGIGQQTVIDRLLDVVVVTAVRALADSDRSQPVGWLAAAGDPIVEQALRLLHDAPQEPWTVERLARSVHVSRATLAARFRRRVGTAPMAYLSDWRLRLASELLEAGGTVGEVASAVGFASPFSFSTAFRRHHGVSPSVFRTRASAR